MSSPLSDKVSLVTGASRGIGRAIALCLGRAGFDLVMNDIAAAELDAAICQVQSSGHRAVAVAGDISEPSVQDRLVAAAVEAFQRLDGLVNNAGVSVRAPGDILDVEPHSYDHCAGINARALFFLTQRVARLLVAAPPGQHHRFIISITSSNAVAVSTDRAEYCISKAAASMATRCFAARLAPHGIGVYEVRPGVVDTAMTSSRLDLYRSRIRDEQLTAIPRVGDPEDVAGCVLTLAEGRLPYTVGQVICVDGGLAMRRY